MSLEQQQTGRYRLLRLLSKDSRDEIYLAEDTPLKRLVAIKLIRVTETLSQQNSVTRLFQHEAAAIARLNHSHILPLYDYWEESIAGESVMYMVMPFCKNGSFADWLAQRRSTSALSLQDIARLITQAASALQYVHKHNIVHQNVKPSSFLIQSNRVQPNSPDLLLTNFGIAKFITADATTTRTVRGTPAYMAPEQWRGLPVPATDQYALATLAYDLLTGRLPFKGSVEQLMELHLHASPSSPDCLDPHIPSAVSAVVLRALAKKTQERFPSVADFALSFQDALLSASSIAASPQLLPAGDLRIPLTLAADEALTGAMRPLRLPDGSVVSVFIPPGIQDGQCLRLEGPGIVGGFARALILTITIKNKAGFDVFLCHNNKDKPAVKEIGKQLKEHGIVPWLDEWELRPGLPWQRTLEAEIAMIHSAAVFVGKDGVGPWQNMELEAFLSEFVQRNCPVIPVLLTDAPETPRLPLFLRNMTWVDFRKLEPDPIELLIWGITGEHGKIS